MQPYLLLDAGGTLVFPDFSYLRGLVAQEGVEVGEERLYRLAAEYIKQLDEALRAQQGDLGMAVFLQAMLEKAGVPPQRIPVVTQRIYERDVQKSLWTFTFPWVREALTRLRDLGYTISIVSNADGRVREQFADLHLLSLVEQIFDSRIVGYEKPDPRMFQHVLHTLGLLPEQCVFVGDVYYIDVLGANRAGIAAVHLDPWGLYADWNGCHIPDVAALPGLLTDPALDLTSPAFFPLRQQ